MVRRRRYESDYDPQLDQKSKGLKRAEFSLRKLISEKENICEDIWSDMYNLDKKVAIVTGAGSESGIGRAIAVRLAKELSLIHISEPTRPY